MVTDVEVMDSDLYKRAHQQWLDAMNQRDALAAALRDIAQQPFTPSNNGERWDEGFRKGHAAALEQVFTAARAALAALEAR